MDDAQKINPNIHTVDGWFRNPVNSSVDMVVKIPIIYRGLSPSQVVGNGISEPSTVPLEGGYSDASSIDTSTFVSFLEGSDETSFEEEAHGFFLRKKRVAM